MSGAVVGELATRSYSQFYNCVPNIDVASLIPYSPFLLSGLTAVRTCSPQIPFGVTRLYHRPRIRTTTGPASLNDSPVFNSLFYSCFALIQLEDRSTTAGVEKDNPRCRFTGKAATCCHSDVLHRVQDFRNRKVTLMSLPSFVPCVFLVCSETVIVMVQS